MNVPTFTFNSVKEICDTILSGQDLYCVDTGEFFTSVDEMYIAIYSITDTELAYYAKKFDESDYDYSHIDDAIPQLPTEILEPNIITADGITISPEDPEYENADARIFDYSNVEDMLSDLSGKRFINADIKSVWDNIILGGYYDEEHPINYL